MHASQSKAQTFRSSCVRDGSIYAPALRARDHSALLDEVVLEIVDRGNAAGADRVSVRVVVVARREAVVGTKVGWDENQERRECSEESAKD
jgi:hypothetical protein